MLMETTGRNEIRMGKGFELFLEKNLNDATFARFNQHILNFRRHFEKRMEL